MDDLMKFCCQNSSCADYGKRGGKNLTVCGHYGENDRYRLLYCRTCKARFSERKGTVFFRSHLPTEKGVSILGHVAEGTGMRKTGRLVKVKEDVVIRYAKLAGEHAKDLHDELVAFSPGHCGGADGREVVLRGQEAEPVRPGRSRR